MDYTSSPESNQQPNQHDYDQLDFTYTHLDDFDSWAAAPTDDGSGGGKGNGKGKKGEPPGQSVREWGKSISKDGKGRPDLFERDLGNGDKLFTHVLWAD